MNPEKYAPRKIDPIKLKEGLSQKQMKRIAYECMLLKKDVQELLYIAPHLFNEGITSANTPVTETIEDKPIYHNPNPYGSYSDDGDEYESYI